MVEAEPRSFADLLAEVVERGVCGKCGGCVSFCSAGKLHALELGEEGFPRFSHEGRCLRCGLCYMICPRTTELDEEVRRRYDWRPPIGKYHAATSARATDPAVRANATDGGVVTALLLYLLDKRAIDGAIVSAKDGPFGRRPIIAATREQVLAAAGSHFSGGPHLENVGEQYTTFTPTISAVKGLEGQRLNRVALVGTPCQVHTMRKMQCLGIVPSDVITYVIGLFCMEQFSFDERTVARLLGRHGVRLEDVAKLNVKEDVIVTLRDGSAHHIPFSEMDEFARPACLACPEFANDYADISVGGLGSPDGYTTTLIRSDKGRLLYAEALRSGYIEERRAEGGAILAKVIEFARRKRERAEGTGTQMNTDETDGHR